MYVIKSKDGRYVRFNSYSVVHWVDRPEQATLYTRKLDADRRLKQSKFYTKDGWVNTKDLFMWEVEFKFTEILCET